MSKYLKFICPDCGCEHLKLVETDAIIGTRLRISETPGEDQFYDDVQVYDATPYKYCCSACGNELPLDPLEDDSDHASLREYLMAQPYNKEED